MRALSERHSKEGIPDSQRFGIEKIFNDGILGGLKHFNTSMAMRYSLRMPIMNSALSRTLLNRRVDLVPDRHSENLEVR